MPELPEVETTLLGLKPHILGQQIQDLTIRQYQLRWPIPKNLPQTISGHTIQTLDRRGKYLLIGTTADLGLPTTERIPTAQTAGSIDPFNPMDSGVHRECAGAGTVIIHLGMSGRLSILPRGTLAKKHDHVDLLLSNHLILRYTDPRRFGAILWTTGNPMAHPLLCHLGPEPFDPHFSGLYLWQQAQNRKTAIKAFIMNHHIVVGVGNIYATEALFMTGIHPATPAKDLSQDQMNKLVAVIKEILHLAILQGGTTLKDFLTTEGKPGYFVNQLKAYGRQGLPCLHCSHPLEKLSIGQRTSTFCAVCQPI